MPVLLCLINRKSVSKEFNEFVGNKKWEEALNKFYDENIVLVDNEGEWLKRIKKVEKLPRRLCGEYQRFGISREECAAK